MGLRSADFIRARGHRHGRTRKPDTWQQPVQAPPISLRPCHAGAIHTWLYLAATGDLATREVVGWSMADHLRAELACDALRMALRRRQPPSGLIQHSDRGV